MCTRIVVFVFYNKAYVYFRTKLDIYTKKIKTYLPVLPARVSVDVVCVERWQPPSRPSKSVVLKTICLVLILCCAKRLSFDLNRWNNIVHVPVVTCGHISNIILYLECP